MLAGRLRALTNDLLVAAAIALPCSTGAFAASNSSAVAAELQMAEAQKNEAVLRSGVGAANNLEAAAQCDPVKGEVVGRLSWDARGSGQQRVDLTAFRDGFETGQFASIGPLPANQGEVELNNGESGISYKWRVLTLSGDAWVPSKAGTLFWPACPRIDEPQRTAR
jgi:hypothetical protein